MVDLNISKLDASNDLVKWSSAAFYFHFFDFISQFIHSLGQSHMVGCVTSFECFSVYVNQIIIQVCPMNSFLLLPPYCYQLTRFPFWDFSAHFTFGHHYIFCFSSTLSFSWIPQRLLLQIFFYFQ